MCAVSSGRQCPLVAAPNNGTNEIISTITISLRDSLSRKCAELPDNNKAVVRLGFDDFTKFVGLGGHSSRFALGAAYVRENTENTLSSPPAWEIFKKS